MRISAKHIVLGLVVLCATVQSALAHPGHDGTPALTEVGEFRYDKADHDVSTTPLGEASAYDAHIVADGQAMWVAWLEFVPGQGDRLWVGRHEDGRWVSKAAVTDRPSALANPTLTLDTRGGLWLSYERESGPQRQWDIVIRRHEGDGRFGQPIGVSPGEGADIRHVVAADGHGGLWFVWQSDRGGQFDVLARRWDGVQLSPIEVVSQSARGDWHPAAVVTSDGALCVAWDGYDGESFNVLTRWRTAAGWSTTRALAPDASFQGRAQLAPAADGDVWVLWESGGLNWGKPFRGLPRLWNNVTDAAGPLHRFRELHLARLSADGRVRMPKQALPMPSFAAGSHRDEARAGVEGLGVYYERGQLITDGADRPWVVYRHFYLPQAGTTQATKHHIEAGWGIYGRFFGKGGWSGLYQFDQPQRDGMQRLSLTAHEGAVAAAYTVGRTDRRTDDQARGVVWGRFQPAADQEGTGPVSEDDLIHAARAQAVASDSFAPPQHPAVTVGGETYRLYFGDLHRHTDLSLCFPFFDGSIDDAYRYAIEVARLDFLGITDHTRDIDRGQVLSQLWWRSVKEVTRHRLRDTFFPYFAYERSHGTTDHNVISLRDDMLRNFPPPLEEFWAEIDGDTFTIPHAPINKATWGIQDDDKRPLLEIFQGCRNFDSQQQAHDGLSKGNHMGFIASSDHLSTGVSFACVWSPIHSREGIFRAMQARRTFGATTKMRLILRAGDNWMGEIIEAASMPRLDYELVAPGDIEEVEVILDGEVVRRLKPDGAAREMRGRIVLEGVAPGEHFVYLHARQRDGHRAWSSPLFIRLDQDKRSAAVNDPSR